MRRTSLISLCILASLFCGTLPVFAHEVYVLSPQEATQAIATPSPNPFSAIPSQELLFLLSGAAVLILLLGVFSISISPTLTRKFDLILLRLKRYAPFAARVTLGVSLLASGYFHDFFGPELPLSRTFPSGANLAGDLMMLIGVLLIVGFLTRLASLIGICFFAAAVYSHGLYMLNYLNYFGEMFLVFALGGALWSVDATWRRDATSRFWKRIERSLERYSFLVVRICFGLAIFFASFYAKFLHSNLALATVNDYHLTAYFHSTPLFLVLGAFLVESLIAVCFLFGFEIRFAAILFTGFLLFSLFFFGEAVWPHLILFGLNITLFLHGYDRYTIEEAFLRTRREPLL